MNGRSYRYRRRLLLHDDVAVRHHCRNLRPHHHQVRCNCCLCPQPGHGIPCSSWTMWHLLMSLNRLHCDHQFYDRHHIHRKQMPHVHPSGQYPSCCHLCSKYMGHPENHRGTPYSLRRLDMRMRRKKRESAWPCPELLSKDLSSLLELSGYWLPG